MAEIIFWTAGILFALLIFAKIALEVFNSGPRFEDELFAEKFEATFGEPLYPANMHWADYRYG